MNIPPPRPQPAVPPPRGSPLVLWIIVPVMFFATIALAAVLYVLRPPASMASGPHAAADPLVVAAWGLPLFALVGFFAVRHTLVAQLRRQVQHHTADAGPGVCAAGFVNISLILAALAEGSATFAMIVFYLTRADALLVLAGACTLAILLALPLRASQAAFDRAIRGPLVV